ncbi:MAG: hypothetical protein Q4C95_12650 [Planctomycetia bacterium]|nr:hypothetical protein [Planctomycetia bacterium]
MMKTKSSKCAKAKCSKVNDEATKAVNPSSSKSSAAKPAKAAAKATKDVVKPAKVKVTAKSANATKVAAPKAAEAKPVKTSKKTPSKVTAAQTSKTTKTSKMAASKAAKTKAQKAVSAIVEEQISDTNPQVIVNTRLTTADKKQISADAKKAKCTLSVYLLKKLTDRWNGWAPSKKQVAKSDSPKKAFCAFHLTTLQKRKLQRTAEEAGVSVSQYVIDTILDRYEVK